MWSALATLAGAGIGAGASIYGARQQAASAERINAVNKEYQDEANRLSIDLANSAHQREVADLRAANLNPILSAGGSGASTPQIGAITADNPGAGFGHSAAEVGKLVASAGRDFANYISDKYYLENKEHESRILNNRAENERILADAYLKRKMADSVKSAQDIFDLGREEVFEPAGSWFGKKLHEWFGAPAEKYFTPGKIFYKGRYRDVFDVYQEDPQYYDNYIKNKKVR